MPPDVLILISTVAEFVPMSAFLPAEGPSLMRELLMLYWLVGLFVFSVLK